MKNVIQVRLDPGDIEKLKKEADKSGHTVSSLARHFITEALKKRRPK